MALLRKINLVKISKNLTIRVFSTENDKIKEESLRYYRTAESNPLKHDERHFGRLYSVSYIFISLRKVHSKFMLCVRFLMKNLESLLNWRKISRTNQPSSQPNLWSVILHLKNRPLWFVNHTWKFYSIFVKSIGQHKIIYASFCGGRWAQESLPPCHKYIILPSIPTLLSSSSIVSEGGFLITKKL